MIHFLIFNKSSFTKIKEYSHTGLVQKHGPSKTTVDYIVQASSKHLNIEFLIDRMISSTLFLIDFLDIEIPSLSTTECCVILLDTEYVYTEK